METHPLCFIDIGANLLDSQFRGKYHDHVKHPADIDHVLQRAWNRGVGKIIVTASDVKNANDTLTFVQQDERLYCTCGVHPCHATDFAAAGERSVLASLQQTLNSCNDTFTNRKIVAIGECGLDYDRLFFASKIDQHNCFLSHFALIREAEQAWQRSLPFFFHCRNTNGDFCRILRDNFDCVQCRLPGNRRGAVIHSFSGGDSKEDVEELVELGCMFSVNGCSMKTEEQVAAVRDLIPVDRLMIETDGPWCEIKPSHAGNAMLQNRIYRHQSSSHPFHAQMLNWLEFTSQTRKVERFELGMMVKGRTEPCHVVRVAAALAEIKGIPLDEEELFYKTLYNNTTDTFFQNHHQS